MKIIAHRGANREALENTWIAFEKAIDAGAEMIELDAQMTADGEVVIVHDDHLQRVVDTTYDMCVSRLTADEVRNLKLKDGSHIPFLKDVIQEILPRIDINIEIKGSSLVLAEKVGDMVSQSKYHDKVLLSSFEWIPLRLLEKKFSFIKRAFLCGGEPAWYVFPSGAPHIFLDEIHTNIIHPCVHIVTENLMDQAKARGWTVNVWIPMDGEEEGREDLWVSMLSLEVDGLCTNYPRQLKRWLEEVDANAEIFARIEKDLAHKVHRT